MNRLSRSTALKIAAVLSFVFSKLQVADRAQAIVKARQAGLE